MVQIKLINNIDSSVLKKRTYVLLHLNLDIFIDKLKSDKSLLSPFSKYIETETIGSFGEVDIKKLPPMIFLYMFFKPFEAANFFLNSPIDCTIYCNQRWAVESGTLITARSIKDVLIDTSKNMILILLIHGKIYKQQVIFLKNLVEDEDLNVYILNIKELYTTHSII